MIDSSTTRNDFDICVGVITAVNGVKGYVKIKSFTENTNDIVKFSKIYDDNNHEYKISIVVLKKDHMIACIDGIKNRNDAEKLRNTKLYIKRSELPIPSNDEYYHADLIGLNAIYADGSKVGKIKNIVNFGAGDIIEISDASSEKSLYYPFTKQFVPQINLRLGYVIVEQLEEMMALSD